MRVLVGDDQPDIIEAVRLLLKAAGHQVVTALTPEALLDQLGAASPVDLVLTDMNYQRDTTSGNEGLELVQRIRTRQPNTPVIVMTAWSTVDLAVQAMQYGAVDFIQKPWDNQRLLAIVEKHGGRTTAATTQPGNAQAELEIARTVQQRLFPSNYRARGLETEGLCLPAREIGGDYYDFLELANDRTGVVLADVSGKGVPAALLMANLQASFRSSGSAPPNGRPDVDAIVGSVNSLFYRSTPPERFATCFFATIDPAGGSMRYANCGHPPALLLRSGGRDSEWLEPTTTVLGIVESLPVESREVALNAGDTVVVFTDGVTESGMDLGNEFNDRSIRECLEMNRGRPLGELVRCLAREAESRQNGLLHDDLTIAAFRLAS